MPEIISESRFSSEYERLLVRYEGLLENSYNDERLIRLGRIFEKMKKSYKANKNFVAKILGNFEKHQPLFKERERAFVVQCIELLKKVLWQKKINKER